MVGNIANYSRQDVLRALFRLQNPKSRLQLVKELGLGEGTVRTVLGILKEKKLISSTNQGHCLSKEGQEFIANVITKFSMPERIKLEQYKDYECAALVVKDCKQQAGYKERDIAVRHGAEGALLLRKDLIIENQYFKELEGKFLINDDDLLVICFAKYLKTAENSCLAIAEELKSLLF